MSSMRLKEEKKLYRDNVPNNTFLNGSISLIETIIEICHQGDGSTTTKVTYEE